MGQAMSNAWNVVEPDVEAALRACPKPLEALADLSVAAFVLRRVFDSDECTRLIERFIDRGLMYDPAAETIEAKFVEASVREGGLHRIGEPTFRMIGGSEPSSRRRRIDVGASLGNLGNRPEEFFTKAREANELFATLFDGLANPVEAIYGYLGRLAEGKRVMTAREPDGRLYGRAIFRIHYGGYTYGPHFDSVRHREKRTGYAVFRFEHQLAGVMCLQNSVRGGQVPQTILHRCLWSPEVGPYLEENRFYEYAAAKGIPNVRIELEPGDLYFFNTGLIHEVPGVDGPLPRAVAATFIGYSADDPDVYVWS